METRYAKVGDAHVAYRLFGEGPIDILIMLGEYIPVDTVDEEPRSARAIRRLASIGRVIVFNRRGVGLSDPPDSPLSHDQAVEDGIAVLDHIGSSKAVIFGSNVSGPAAIMLAARHPDRTSALILANSVARFTRAPDYPIGIPTDQMAQISEQTTATEPTEEFDFLTSFAPSVAKDDAFRAWWDRAGHRGASPTRSRQLWRILLETDVREDLARITAPTLVIARSGLPFAASTRYVSEHIAGARYVELQGADLPWWVGDADAALDEIEAFLAREVGASRRAQRRLATVLFIDVVSSTERAVAMGDQRWRDLLGTYHDIARRHLSRWGGVPVGTSGDGIVATFDMPADAVHCAKAVAEGVHAIDVDIRAGVHTGEIEILDDDVAGIGVHIAARVMSAAEPGEVLVSRTVADLVTGSGLAFEDRGEHDLKGVPGAWTLLALRP